jgi:hypothetical protein
VTATSHATRMNDGSGRGAPVTATSSAVAATGVANPNAITASATRAP